LPLPPSWRRARVAQDFPTRTITMIVPLRGRRPERRHRAPRGPIHGGTLKQQVVIENVAGAAGPRARPASPRRTRTAHGLIHHVALAAGASLYKTLPYDTLSDIETWAS
jgi:tripartite-type tricarboxylate transporter receptor subunit TctC